MLARNKPSELHGVVEAVLIAPSFDSIVSVEVPKIELFIHSGIKGDRHAGRRLMDVREYELKEFGFLKDMEIANYREFSAISVEELAVVTQGMHLTKPLPFGLLGENIVISGIPDFSKIPPGSLMFFKKSNEMIRTAVLAVWRKNEPCHLPANEIKIRVPGLAGRVVTEFKSWAQGRRGLVGSVYCSGTIHKGDSVIIKIPGSMR